MNILTLPLRNLSAQRARTALTILGIAVAVASFVALTGLTRGLQASYQSGVGDVGGDLIVSQRGTYSLVSSSIPEDLTPRFAAIEGVREAAAVLLQICELDEKANIFVAGWPDGSFLYRSLTLAAGTPPLRDRDVVLGSTIAEALGKGVGDEVQIQYESFTITGISVSDSVFNQNIAITRLAVLQDILGRPGNVSLLEIQLERPVTDAEVARIRDEMAAVSTTLAVSNSEEFAGSMDFVRTVGAIASSVSLIMVFASSVLVANTLLMAVSERTQEFGILAAIGWRPGRIRMLVVAEGLIMCLVASFIGIGLGILAMHVVSWMRVSAGLLEPYYTPAIIAEAVGWVLLVGPVAALYPAWRVTRLAPAAALRGRR